MPIENRFNLIDEPWIPIVDVGKVSLKDIFSRSDYRALGGNPVQKIALTKLLLAIAQAAVTPEDDEAWAELGAEGLAAKCLAYLDKWHDRFWLYCDRPFLQLNELKNYKIQPIGALCHHVSTGNNTILNETQIERTLTDAEWALTVLVDQNFSVKHNLAHGALTLDGGKGKGKATKSGPALGSGSYLHHFLQGNNLLQTIWFNQLSKESIEKLPFKYNLEHSRPIWEFVITNRDSKEAEIIKESYLGRLCPLSRFIIKEERNIKYCEGIVYPYHYEGGREISVAYGISKKGDPYSLNVDPVMRPWRSLPALLSFFTAAQSMALDCLQLKLSLYAGRIRYQSDGFGIWSGGVLLRGDSYSQFAKGDDDTIESEVRIENTFFEDPSNWLSNLQHELNILKEFQDELKKATYLYHQREIKESKERDKRADAIAKNAVSQYWQLCERKFQDLVDVCDDFNQAKAMRKNFAGFANQAYDRFCAKDTARQLDAWAKNRPNLGKYLKDQTKTEEAPA